MMFSASGWAAVSKKKSRASSAKRTTSGTAITARGIYAYDLTHRRVLLSRNASATFYPASTTKLLTALVVLDKMKLEDRVVVSRRAWGVTPTKAGLKSGHDYPVRDLLEALLASSANDAAVALAEAVSGSETAFAGLMNAKARALGARRSKFVNASGLPDKRQVTTPYDLFLITRAAFSDPFIKDVMAQKSVCVLSQEGHQVTCRNHNKLLWRLSDPKVLGKTGYTLTARHCYAGIAYYDDRKVVIVMLKSRRPWDDIARILKVRLRPS